MNPESLPRESVIVFAAAKEVAQRFHRDQVTKILHADINDGLGDGLDLVDQAEIGTIDKTEEAGNQNRIKLDDLFEVMHGTPFIIDQLGQPQGNMREGLKLTEFSDQLLG